MRTITLPPISSRRIRFGEPTSSRPSGVTVAAFSPSPWRAIARPPRARRRSRSRGDARARGRSAAARARGRATSGCSTRSDASSSSCPVWSPSRTTIVRGSMSGPEFSRSSCFASSTRETRRSDAYCRRRIHYRLSSCKARKRFAPRGGNRGAKDRSGLRQVRHGSRGRKGRGDARHVHRRAARREGCRSLRSVRRNDARARPSPAAAASRNRWPDFRPSGVEADTSVPRPDAAEHVPVARSGLQPMAARKRAGEAPDYHAPVGLSLVVGPAHAGKVALLLDRFVDALDRDPWLVVPNRADVERVERELVERCGGLLAGTVATFDGLFEHLAELTGGGDACSGRPSARSSLRRVAERHPAGQRSLRRATRTRWGGRSRELDGALLEPEDVGEPLAAALRARTARELDRLGAWDRGALRRRAIERLTGDLDAWGGAPGLRPRLRGPHRCRVATARGALGARSDVHVSLPYEPGRAVVRVARADGRRPRSASRTETSSSCRRARTTSCRRRSRTSSGSSSPIAVAEPARLRRSASSKAPAGAERSSSSPTRCSASSRSGVAAGGDRRRLPLRRAASGSRSRRRSARLGVPLAFEARVASADDPVRARPARPASLRLAGRRATRAVRAPALAVLRRRTPRTSTGSKGRLRGRACVRGDRATAVTIELRDGRPLPTLDAGARRGAGARRREAARGRDAAATPTGRRRHRSTTGARLDLQAHDAVTRTLDELEALAASGLELGRADVLSALERATVRRERPGAPGRVAVLDLMRARTRRFDTVFVARARAGHAPTQATERAVPRRRHATSARRPARGPPRPTRRSEPRPLPLRDGVLAPAAAARPRPPGGRRRGLAAGAEPVLGGVRELFDAGRRPPAHGAAAALGASPATSRLRRPSASGCARSRALGSRNRARPPPWRARTAGAGGWSERRAAFDRRTAADARARAPARRRPRRVLGLRARADGVVLRRVVRRAVPPARRRSTRRSTA